MKLDNNLKIAIEASLKAGAVIMQVYDTAFDVEIKDDKAIVDYQGEKRDQKNQE